MSNDAETIDKECHIYDYDTEDDSWKPVVSISVHFAPNSSLGSKRGNNMGTPQENQKERDVSGVWCK